jgi:outer membrane immunogenic protein
MTTLGPRTARFLALVLTLTFAGPATGYDWSGVYLGVNLGGAGSSGVKTTEKGSAGGVFPAGTGYNGAGHSWKYDLSNSFTGGGVAGYNFQLGSAVFGVEGEFGYLRMRGSKSDPLSPFSDPVSRTRVGDWYGVLAGRVGFAWEQFLPYVKAGMAVTSVDGAVLDACLSGTCGTRSVSARKESTKPYWAFAAGLEYAIVQNWIVRTEYMYVGLGLTDALRVSGPGSGTAAGSTWVWKQDINSVHMGKIGITYKF